MYPSERKLTRPLVALLLVLWGNLALAQAAQPNRFTWGELSLLPEYCRDTQGVLYNVHGEGKDSPRSPHWVGLMGEDFWHMHHYCWALRDINRSAAPGMTPSKKTALLNQAIADLSYVVQSCQPTMPLLPEVWLRMGETQLKLGNLVDAKNAFEKSRSLKADYWPAYVAWADVLIELKQFEQARALVEEGLKNAPDAVPLQTRFASLSKAKGRSAPAAAAPTAGKPQRRPAATASAPL